jgi:hypothetical protein
MNCRRACDCAERFVLTRRDRWCYATGARRQLTVHAALDGELQAETPLLPADGSHCVLLAPCRGRMSDRPYARVLIDAGDGRAIRVLGEVLKSNDDRRDRHRPGNQD